MALAVLVVWAAPVDRARAAPAPDRYRIGVYVTAIENVDIAAGTFGADFWVWSIAPSAMRDPKLAF